MKLTSLVTLTLVAITTARPIEAIEASEASAQGGWSAHHFMRRLRCVWHFYGEKIPENAVCLRICNTKGLGPGEPCQAPLPGGTGYDFDN